MTEKDDLKCLIWDLKVADGEIWAKTARLLGELRDPRAMEPLLQVLQDPNGKNCSP